MIPHFSLDTLFAGGAAVAVSGMLFNMLRGVPAQILGVLRRQFTTVLRIGNNTSAFSAALDYVNALKPRRFRSIAVHRSAAGSTVTGIGTRAEWFFHRGRLVQVERSIKDSNATVEVSKSNTQVLRSEDLTFTFYTRNKSLAYEFFDSLQKEAAKEPLQFYRSSTWGDVTKVGDLSLRGEDSIVMATGLWEAITKDIDEFLVSEPRYNSLGIPWKRGYLLYGPPGGGKTSLIKTLAGKYGRDLCQVALGDKDWDDGNFAKLLSIDGNLIMLMEDLDCAIRAADSKDGLTFSGLLNAIDGVYFYPGRILIATTNHIDKIDPALLRPGRFDRKFEVGYATAEQAERYLQRFYGTSGFTGCNIVPNLSMAQVQEICIESPTYMDAAKRVFTIDF